MTPFYKTNQCNIHDFCPQVKLFLTVYGLQKKRAPAAQGLFFDLFDN